MWLNIEIYSLISHSIKPVNKRCVDLLPSTHHLNIIFIMTIVNNYLPIPHPQFFCIILYVNTLFLYAFLRLVYKMRDVLNKTNVMQRNNNINTSLYLYYGVKIYDRREFRFDLEYI